jgi:hypothetical protein
MTERRIKVVGSITGVNYGRLVREGFSAYDLEAMPSNALRDQEVCHEQ